MRQAHSLGGEVSGTVLSGPPHPMLAWSSETQKFPTCPCPSTKSSFSVCVCVCVSFLFCLDGKFATFSLLQSNQSQASGFKTCRPEWNSSLSFSIRNNTCPALGYRPYVAPASRYPCNLAADFVLDFWWDFAMRCDDASSCACLT